MRSGDIASFVPELGGMLDQFSLCRRPAIESD
jgi:hypothetical protein